MSVSPPAIASRARESESFAPCPACGGTGARLAFVVRSYQHARCTSCRTVYVDPPPTDAQLSEIYAVDEYDVARALEPRLRAEARLRCKLLLARGARTVLDVGCAAGFFLDVAREEGLTVVGVEPGPAGDDAIRRGHEVHRTWLQSASFSGRRFDAISMWEVLEHVSKPLDLLRAAELHLAPGGVLAFSTPSMSGLPARLLGAHFPMVNPPQHLTLLSRAGLSKLLERAGLEVASISSFSNLHASQIENRVGRLPYAWSLAAGFVAPPLGRAFEAAAKLVDRAGYGSEFQVLATPRSR